MIHQSESPRHEMTSGEAGVVGAVLGFGVTVQVVGASLSREGTASALRCERIALPR